MYAVADSSKTRGIKISPLAQDLSFQTKVVNKKAPINPLPWLSRQEMSFAGGTYENKPKLCLLHPIFQIAYDSRSIIPATCSWLLEISALSYLLAISFILWPAPMVTP